MGAVDHLGLGQNNFWNKIPLLCFLHDLQCISKDSELFCRCVWLSRLMGLLVPGGVMCGTQWDFLTKFLSDFQNLIWICRENSQHQSEIFFLQNKNKRLNAKLSPAKQFLCDRQFLPLGKNGMFSDNFNSFLNLIEY